jgi:hypothetical protein
MTTFTIFAFLKGSRNLAARTEQGDIGYIDSQGMFHNMGKDFEYLATAKYGYEPLVTELQVDERGLRSIQEQSALSS